MSWIIEDFFFSAVFNNFTSIHNRDTVRHIAYSPRFLKRVNYRLGAGFATPYYKINNNDGPKELSVSCGFGIPIFNGYYANRPITSSSVVNISAQWVRSSAAGFITDNSFRLNIGITFNERWFAKWKVE